MFVVRIVLALAAAAATESNLLQAFLLIWLF